MQKGFVVTVCVVCHMQVAVPLRCVNYYWHQLHPVETQAQEASVYYQCHSVNCLTFAINAEHIRCFTLAVINSYCFAGAAQLN